MTDAKPPLFRPEAVAHHQAGRTERRPVDYDSPHTVWSFRALVGVLLLAVVLASVIHADETARGPATVARDGRAAELLLPAGATPRIQVGQDARVAFGDETVTGTVTAVSRPRAAGDGIVLPVTVRLDTPAPALDGRTGEGKVRLARTPVIALLASGFRKLWTSGG